MLNCTWQQLFHLKSRDIPYRQRSCRLETATQPLRNNCLDRAILCCHKCFLVDDQNDDHDGHENDDDEEEDQDKINANSLFEGPWTSSPACHISFKCESPPEHNVISLYSSMICLFIAQ